MNVNEKRFFRQEFRAFKKAYEQGDNVTDMVDHLSVRFLEAGVTSRSLLDMMSSDSIYRHFDELCKHGLKADFSKMLDRLSPQLIANNLQKFIDWGCDAKLLLDHMYPHDIEDNMCLLLDAGLSPDAFVNKLHEEGENLWLCNNLSSQLLAKNLEKLLMWGCDPDLFVDRMNVEDIEYNIILLMSSGASAGKLIEILSNNDERSWMTFNWALFETYYPSRDLVLAAS